VRHILLISIFLVGASSAADRPFDFSANKDTSKAKVLVTEGNRMVDDIYSQFEAKDGVFRIRKFQIVSMSVVFDSIDDGATANVDTFTIRDYRGNKVRFGNLDYRIYATSKVAWLNGVQADVGNVRYWYSLTDSSFIMAISYRYVWDTLNVLIFGETK
jgi:hypothetical protein